MLAPVGELGFKNEIRTKYSGKIRLVWIYEFRPYLLRICNSLSFRKPAIQTWTATMETGLANTEKLDFSNVEGTRSSEDAETGTYSAKLTPQQRIGSWKSMPITQGDEISAKVGAKYTQTPNKGNGTSISLFITNHWNYGTYTDPDGNIQNAPFDLQNLSIGITATPSNTNTENGNAVPNAYLKMVFYDANNTYHSQHFVQVTGVAKNNWELLDLSNVVAPTTGRVEIFVANESEVTVYFDNVEIDFNPTMIVQENHYYPFGMNLAGIEKQGMPEDRFQFQGVEKEVSFGLHWQETGLRGYDAQLGRFHQIDIVVGKYVALSPYNYAFNNPTMFSDPSGADPKYNWDDGNYYDNGKEVSWDCVQNWINKNDSKGSNSVKGQRIDVYVTAPFRQLDNTGNEICDNCMSTQMTRAIESKHDSKRTTPLEILEVTTFSEFLTGLLKLKNEYAIGGTLYIRNLIFGSHGFSTLPSFRVGNEIFDADKKYGNIKIFATLVKNNINIQNTILGACHAGGGVNAEKALPFIKDLGMITESNVFANCSWGNCGRLFKGKPFHPSKKRLNELRYDTIPSGEYNKVARPMLLTAAGKWLYFNHNTKAQKYVYNFTFHRAGNVTFSNKK